MQEIRKISKKKLTNEEVFEKSSSKTRELFFTEISKELKEISTQNNNKFNIIFLDKNNPPNILQTSIQFIQEKLSKYKNLNTKITLITPINQTMKKSSFPFSKKLLFFCLNRVFKRENHETLEGNYKKKLYVLLMFYNFYNRIKFCKESYRNTLQLDYFIEFPFVNEDNNEEESKFPSDLIENLDYLLKTFTFNGLEKDQEFLISVKVDKFLESFEKHKELFNEEFSIENIELIVKEKLNECLKIFTNEEEEKLMNLKKSEEEQEKEINFEEEKNEKNI